MVRLNHAGVNHSGVEQERVDVERRRHRVARCCEVNRAGAVAGFPLLRRLDDLEAEVVRA